MSGAVLKHKYSSVSVVTIHRLTNAEYFAVTVGSEKHLKPAGDDLKMTDILILESILSDGHYDNISEDDRLALKSIIVTLQTLAA